MKDISSTASLLTSSPEQKVFGVSGSPRRNGNSDLLLQEILAGVASENIGSTSLNLSGITFKGCIGCEKCRTDKICTGLSDEMTDLYSDIITSKGLVLISPTHNYNITAWMKAFIDRLYCFYNFTDDRPRQWSSNLAGQDRKAVIAAICEQENEEDMGFTLEAMKAPLSALGYEIIGELSVYTLFDKGKVKEHREYMDNARNLGQTLAHSLRN